jgi:hypothetical protein
MAVVCAAVWCVRALFGARGDGGVRGAGSGGGVRGAGRVGGRRSAAAARGVGGLGGSGRHAPHGVVDEGFARRSAIMTKREAHLPVSEGEVDRQLHVRGQLIK